MSTIADAGRDKADQIALHFYTKLFNVINAACATGELPDTAKTDKWFNLELPESDLFPREVKERYKRATVSPPPFELQVLLSVPELINNQVLVQLNSNASRTRIDPTPRFILLESWKFTHTSTRPFDDIDGRDPKVLPTIYKHAITLFRSLYTFLRLLPSWALYKRIRRKATPQRVNNFSIELRIRSDFEDDSNLSVLCFGVPPSRSSLPLTNQSHTFSPIPHPTGTLTLSTTYLTNPTFQLDELESLLSSHILSMDEGPEFVPTLVKNQNQRSSLMTTSSSPGRVSHVPSRSPGGTPSRAFPIVKATSKSPPEFPADRYTIPGRPPTALPSDTPRSEHQQSLRLNTMHIRNASNPYSSSPTTTPSAFPSRDEGIGSPYARPASGLGLARIRKESTGAEMSTSPSASTYSVAGATSTTPLPIRRVTNVVHPFKSNTLSSPSSLHSIHSVTSSSPRNSPLGLPTSTSGGGGFQPSLSGRASPGPRVPPSPIGMGMAVGTPGGSNNRPSPQFAPSSLGDRRSLASADGVSEDVGSRPIAARKRYSSSFGPRLLPTSTSGSPAGTSGLGEGSPSSGAGGIVPRERKESVSSLTAGPNEEDELSSFVREIDSRKPLSGRSKFHNHGSDPGRLWEQEGDRDNRGRDDSYSGLSEEASGATGRAISPFVTQNVGAIGAKGEISTREYGPFTDSNHNEPRQPLSGIPSSLPHRPRLDMRTASQRPLDPLNLGNPNPTISTVAPTPTTPGNPSNAVNSPPKYVMTGHDEISAHLEKLNQTFLSSLEGLGSGRPKSNRGGKDGAVTSIAAPVRTHALRMGENSNSSSTAGLGSTAISIVSASASGSGECLTSDSGSSADSAHVVPASAGTGVTIPRGIGFRAEVGPAGRRYPLASAYTERHERQSSSSRQVSFSAGSDSMGLGSQEVLGKMDVDPPTTNNTTSATNTPIPHHQYTQFTRFSSDR